MASQELTQMGRMLVLKFAWLISLAALYGLYRIMLWFGTLSPDQVEYALIAGMAFIVVAVLGSASISIYRDIVMHRAWKAGIRARNQAQREHRTGQRRWQDYVA